MYPNKDYPHYGVFVKNFNDMICQSDNYFIKHKVVIEGKRSSVFLKFVAYLIFFIKIVLKGIFCSYDIIYVHYFKYSIYPTYLLKKWRKRKKLIYNFHGSDLIKDNADSFTLTKSKIRVLNLADAIVVPSNYYKDLIVSAVPSFVDKIFVSPSGGVNEEIFYPNDSFIFEKEVKLGYVGRLDVRKGVEVFINALSLMQMNNLLFRAYIIGSGELKLDYLELVKALNVEDNIEFLAPQPQSILRDYYAQFDLLIFPTYRKSESLGLVGLEALSCETPVIGSNIGEIQYYIKEGKNGFLFEQQNEVELFDKISKYIELNVKDRINMRKYAKSSIKEYETKNVQKQMLVFLDKLYQ